MKVSIVDEQVVVIKPSFTAEQIEKLALIQPSALRLVDADGSVLFEVKVTKDVPSLSQFGCTFNPKRNIYIMYEKPVTEAMVRKEFTAAFHRLTKIEAQIKAAIDALGTEAEIVFEAVEA